LATLLQVVVIEKVRVITGVGGEVRKAVQTGAARELGEIFENERGQ
jgi:hypothetical protein